MMLRVSLYERIADIDRPLWDTIGSDPLSTHDVLNALEHANLSGVSMRYVLVSDRKGRLLAAAPITRMAIDGELLTHGFFRRLIQIVRTVHCGFLNTSLLVCGTPLSVGNAPVRMAHDAPRLGVLRELAGLLNEIADSEGVPWRVFKEFESNDLQAVRETMCEGARAWLLAPSEPNSTLTIDWRSYDAYLSRLRSHYRYKIRTAARKLEDCRVSVDVVPMAEVYDSTLHGLYEQVYERAAIKLEHLTVDFFKAIGRAFGDRAPLIRFNRDGQTIGWVVMLFAGDAAYDLFHGINYEDNERSALYFNQLAAAVRLAIERGARRLSLGQSTEVAKARFGATPSPLWTAIRHREKTVNVILRRGCRVMFPTKQIPPRHVFQDASPRCHS